MQALETRSAKASSAAKTVPDHPEADSTQLSSEAASGNYPSGIPTRGIPLPSSTEQEERAIRQALQDSPWREVRGIVCRTNPSHVFLTGQVTCFFMKQMAQETIKHTLGGKQIRNYVRVADTSQSDRKPW